MRRVLARSVPPWVFGKHGVGVGLGMDREQLIQRLRARVRRGGPAEQVWWNGELLHVSEALVRAADLSENETIRARGDDVVIPRTLRDDR